LNNYQTNLNKKAVAFATAFFVPQLDVSNDIGENITNSRAEQRQNNNDDDGNQNENQCVFNQTLPFFAGNEQHVDFTSFRVQEII
jgi:hypothetical protein